MAKRHNEQTNCNKINLNHSRGATDNLMKFITEEDTDMVMIRETYLYQNSIKGITSGYQTYTQGNGKNTVAILITNNTIDALLPTQYSDEDTVLLEILKGNKKFYAANMYMDYKEEIDNSLKKIENIIQFAKEENL